MRLRDERRDLLLAILKADVPAEELTHLRLALLSQEDALDGVIRATARRQTLANAIDGLEVKGLLHPAGPGNGKPGSLRSKLARLPRGIGGEAHETVRRPG